MRGAGVGGEGLGKGLMVEVKVNGGETHLRENDFVGLAEGRLELG